MSQNGVHAGKDGPDFVYGKKNLDKVPGGDKSRVFPDQDITSQSAIQKDLTQDDNNEFPTPQEMLDEEVDIGDVIKVFRDDKDKEILDSPDYDVVRQRVYNEVESLTKEKNFDLVEVLKDLQEPDGGATLNIQNGKYKLEGFGYSPYEERSVGLDIDDIKVSHIKQYIEDNQDLLSKEEHCLGLWHDPDSNTVYIDVSIVGSDVQTAREECLKHDQIAFFDFQVGKSVTVNKNATSGMNS